MGRKYEFTVLVEKIVGQNEVFVCVLQNKCYKGTLKKYKNSKENLHWKEIKKRKKFKIGKGSSGDDNAITFAL